MKKKSVIICLLAAVSATTIAAAAGCGNGHDHSYTWKYDSEQHWQECECGDVKGTAAHADADNNGKCDACQVDCSSVTFNMNGHGEQLPVQVVFMSGKAVKPTDPEEDGWVFVGWYTDADCTEGNEYDFETSVSANVTLYASWTKDLRAIITFDVQGHGTAPKTQKILPGEGNKVAEPEAPTADGCTFAGWYVDAACTVEYDFDDEVAESMTLYAKWNVTVTFSTVYGTAPATQTIKAGSKLDKTKIADPTTEENYQFIGWYTDVDGTKLFNTNAPVNSSLTVYAKWIVPLPHISVGEMKLYSFGSETQLQFIFTATVDGRYCFSLGTGNSQKCTFTSDVDSSVFDKDHDMYFDLYEGQSVILTLFRGSDVADTANVRIVVDMNKDEDLPSEGWVNGRYTDGTVYLDLNGKNVTVNETGPYEATYIGGSFNMLVIKMGEKECTLQATDVYGVYTYTYYNSASRLVTTTLKHFVEVDVDKLSGVYKPKTVSVNNITAICIYESGNGYYNMWEPKMLQTIRYSIKLGEDGSYYESSRNELHYGSYIITPVFDDAGKVTGINVTAPSSGGSQSAVAYAKTSDAPDEPPTKLPLPDDIELVGETYSINGQQWSDPEEKFPYTIEITAYDKTKGIYTISCGGKEYKLKIEGEGDEITVSVYVDVKVEEEVHEELKDTLHKKVIKSVELKMDGTVNEVTPDMISNGYVIYTIPKTGVYTVTVLSSQPIPDWGYGIFATQFYADYENDLLTYEYMEDVNTPSNKIVLQQGNKFAINVTEYGADFQSLTFVLTETVPDPGTSPDNAVEINGLGNTSVNVTSDGNFYVKFTASEAGTYHITLSYADWSGAPTYNIDYKVDGVQNGAVAPDWDTVWTYTYYQDGEVVDGPEVYATVTVTAGKEVSIVFVGMSYYNSVTVNIEKA
ncbi:MAG: InlB B-repeat-containing protein [Clostridia bacterium]|nr:InlB B-repeat-containing protein [Clostridia bacterium]